MKESGLHSDPFFFTPGRRGQRPGEHTEEMPELKIKNAYYVLLGIMGVIVIGLLLLFRKMRWSGV